MRRLKILSVLFFLALSNFLGACSTVEGFGKDIQSLGAAVQGSSKNAESSGGAGQKAPTSDAVVTPVK